MLLELKRLPSCLAWISVNCRDRWHRPRKSRTFSTRFEASLGSPGLGQVNRPRKGFAIQRHLQDVSQVHRRPSGTLQYLLPATKAISNDECVRCCVPHGWQQDSLSYGLRYLELIFLKTKRPGHSTTSGVQGLQFHTHLPEYRFLISDFHECLMVAVAMKNNFSGEVRRMILRSLILQELTEKECLLPEPPGALVGGK